MAVKSSDRGDGITKHETFTWEAGDEGEPEIAPIIETRTLEGMLNLIERECFEVMREAELPDYHGSWNFNEEGEWMYPPSIDKSLAGWKIANSHWPIAEAKGYKEDSPAGFAARILQQAALIRRGWQTSGGKEGAALQAIHLGYLRAEMRIKREHEPTWATGHKTRTTLGDFRNRQNAKMKATAEENHRTWQAIADDIWSRKPNLKKNAVARLIKNKIGGAENTIRQAIKKPDGTG